MTNISDQFSDLPETETIVRPEHLRQADALYRAASLQIEEAHRLVGKTKVQEPFDAGYIAYLEGHILETGDNEFELEDIRSGYFLLCRMAEWNVAA
ncbi:MULTISPECIES: hypothetical protein [unclassified Mesorhizobium]|uniref:hypothetical protein n=1 Tax=unclassified Mesorhizobium TaxID=325217 RepID=UPI00333B44C7